MLLSCADANSRPATLDAKAEMASLTRHVNYRLQWQPIAGATAQPHLVAGVVHTWSLELVGCPQPRNDLGWLSPIGTAWANHAEDADGSQWMVARGESLGSPAATSEQFAVHHPPCELLWVISHGSRQSGAQPQDPAFEATIQWQDAEGAHTRQVATAVGHGRKLALGVMPAGDLQVVLTRNPNIDLQGLDLAGATTEALAWAVLDRIVTGAAVEVR